jgi:hypothetical protein
MTEPTMIDAATALRLLGDGELDVQGRLVDASNATLFCNVALAGVEACCVYKPIAGERPLWDFPEGTLANREVAAYLVSDALGWGIVPPTVMRDGPFGPGMCQLWIDVDESVDLGVLARSDLPQLRRMALFDDKLRTLLWAWRGRRIEREFADELRSLRTDLDGALCEQLSALLSAAEVHATRRRVDRLLATGKYPLPTGDWPAVPWPPF